jgi:predicted membrane channel-forming protein YqfA (hemolysin III family)
VDESTRAWIYRVGAVAILALIVVDVVQGGSAADWIAWIAGAIGLGAAGLAAANTSTERPPDVDLDARLGR